MDNDILNVFQVLSQGSHDCYFLRNSRLVFELKGFEIVFDFDDSDGFKEDDFHSNLEHDQLVLISGFKIIDCFVASTEYLGYRADIIEYQEPISISARSILVQKSINEIDPFAIHNRKLTLNYGYDDVSPEFCNSEPNYLFQVHLTSRVYSDSSFFHKLLKCEFLNSGETTPPSFYWIFYKKYEEIKDSNEVNILGTNTKTRRIGYLKIMGEFINKREKVGSNTIARKFEEYATNYSHYLKSLSNEKGAIKITRNGISAKPYIDFAKDLRILNVTNNIYSSGKIFKVYNLLRLNYEEKNENPFILNNLDKLFFLEAIIKYDFLYISLLLELIQTYGRTSYSQLTRSFHPLLIERLQEVTDTSEYGDRNVLEVKTVLKRVKEWKKPEVYLEHVLMPRLNWLHDLEILSLDQSLNTSLTEYGLRLLDNLCYWNDINWSRVVSPAEFIKTFMVHLFDDVYAKEKVDESKLDAEEVANKTLSYIDESFKFFQTLAPNRVTASQAITYSKYRLYLEDNIPVGHNWIVSILKESKQDQFIYKYQRQYDDGYIQKVKK